MILDAEKKFIFIHIPKTAGTSVRHALKPKKPTSPNALNAATNKRTKHETYSEFIGNFSKRTGLDKKVLDDFTFIAFVRHPVQRFVSLHSYLLKSHRKTYPLVPESIDTFVEDVVYKKHFYLKKIRSLKTQHSFIEGIEDSQKIIGRYENLTKDWEKISSHFGIRSKLLHLNKTSHNSIGMTRKSEQLISEYFSTDFDHFGY